MWEKLRDALSEARLQHETSAAIYSSKIATKRSKRMLSRVDSSEHNSVIEKMEEKVVTREEEALNTAS